MAYRCVKNHFRECDGCMGCKGENYYCPECGEAVERYVYVNNDGTIIGCDNCIERRYVEDVMDGEDDEEEEEEYYG